MTVTGYLVLLCLTSYALSAAAGRHSRTHLGLVLVGCSALLAASLYTLASDSTWDWRPGIIVGGEPVHLYFDALSAFFAVLVAVVGAAGAAYARQYWTEREHPGSARSARAWWSVLLLSMTLLLCSSNGLHFLIAWEAFAVGAYFLITSDRQHAEVRAAGWIYLGASHLGTLLLFAFFAGLAAATGSWDLGPMLGRPDLAPYFWLALVGFGVKAGMFPLHFWLPSGHANAPSHVSAIMSGVALKMGLYGIFRFSSWLPTPAGAGWVVAALGITSAVLGVAFALGQHDLKRLLAYHSVENVGIILMGLGFGIIGARHDSAAWGRLAMAGGLLHVWNHGLFKSLLFLGAGSVVHATGTRHMSRLGGLWRTMPWTTACFALGAAAIAGLPPLNGFVSEWLLYVGLFSSVLEHSTSAWGAVVAAILLGTTGALAVACFVKVCGVVFLGQPRSAVAARAHEAGLWMRVPMVALATGCVAIGLAPTLFWRFLSPAIGAWLPAWGGAPIPDGLASLGIAHLVVAGTGITAAVALWARASSVGIERAVTWDCGYAAPDATMQYTAGSFAAIITGWFGWILRPQRHLRRPQGIFPPDAECSTHTPETVLEFVVKPVSKLVLHLSHQARRLQRGRVQAYILYLLAGLAAVALIVAFGVGR